MPQPIRVLLVGVLSLVAGLLVAFLIFLVEQATDVALYSFSAAVVVPIGAVGCGFLAAAGFHGASRVLHVRPAGPALGIPLMTAAATFVAAHWLTFTRYELPTGRTIAEALELSGLGFGDYLRMVATGSDLPRFLTAKIATPTSIDQLGSWGYAVLAIQIVGFALGGWFVATLLRQKPWCRASHRFLKPQGTLKSHFEDPDRFESSANNLVDVLERGGPVAAFEYATVAKPTIKNRRDARFCVTTEHFECTDCGARHTVVSTHQRTNNNNWAQLSQTPLHPGSAPVDVVRLI